jgi:hypothetical protein
MLSEKFVAAWHDRFWFPRRAAGHRIEKLQRVDFLVDGRRRNSREVLVGQQRVMVWREWILGKRIRLRVSCRSCGSRLNPDIDLIWFDEDPIAWLQRVRAIPDQAVVGRVHRDAVPAQVLDVEDAAPERDLGVPP